MDRVAVCHCQCLQMKVVATVAIMVVATEVVKVGITVAVMVITMVTMAIMATTKAMTMTGMITASAVMVEITMTGMIVVNVAAVAMIGKRLSSNSEFRSAFAVT